MIGPSGCLLARERGATDDATESGAQAGYGDGPRIFDAIWSPEPDVVHQAACTAISLLDDTGSDDARSTPSVPRRSQVRPSCAERRS